MTTTAKKRFDWTLATAFGLLTVAFVVMAATNKGFFDWVWARHHNLLSWYIRPLFLIPFCYFAYGEAGPACWALFLASPPACSGSPNRKR